MEVKFYCSNELGNLSNVRTPHHDRLILLRENRDELLQFLNRTIYLDKNKWYISWDNSFKSWTYYYVEEPNFEVIPHFGVKDHAVYHFIEDIGKYCFTMVID